MNAPMLFEELAPNYASACFPDPRPFQDTAHVEAHRQVVFEAIRGAR
jgi:hypothetical protein